MSSKKLAAKKRAAKRRAARKRRLQALHAPLAPPTPQLAARCEPSAPHLTALRSSRVSVRRYVINAMTTVSTMLLNSLWTVVARSAYRSQADRRNDDTRLSA